MAKFLLVALFLLCGCATNISPLVERSYTFIDTYNNILNYCYTLLLERGKWECEHIPPSPLLINYTPSPPKSSLEKAAPIIGTLKDVGEAVGPLLIPALIGKTLSE